MKEQIEKVLKQLLDCAADQKNNEYNLCNGLGEIEINKTTYQIQISLIVDKKLWTKEDEILFSECTKIHK